MTEFRLSHIELDCPMPGDVAFLCRFHPLETARVAIEDPKAVADLREPEVEIRELCRQLMAIQRSKSDELIRKRVSDFNRVWEGAISKRSKN